MLSDEALFDHIRSGDMGAFDTLYGRYERRLFSFILRYVKRREEAEEIFHEAFMAVLESKKITFDNASFSTWLFQIARNKSLNRLRSRGREQRQAGFASGEILGGAPVDIHQNLENAQISRALTQAVAQLSPVLAEVYHLRSSGMSYEAMAVILEIPTGTIKSRLHEMVSQLRKEMQKWTAR